MTFTKTLLVGLALSLLGGLPGIVAGQAVNQTTVLTFSQPFEIPGQVLPAGTYTFQLVDSLSDRHIVQISSADGSRPIAIVLAIANYRLEPTERTVITFDEAPVGAPEIIRAWFSPGRNWGQEFVYPRRRALELAAASKVVVPAIPDAAIEPDLESVEIVAITPEREERPVAAVIQTTPAPGQQTEASTSTSQSASSTQPASTSTARQLPQTASPLSLMALLGFASFGAATLLLFGRRLARRRPVPVVVP